MLILSILVASYNKVFNTFVSILLMVNIFLRSSQHYHPRPFNVCKSTKLQKYDKIFWSSVKAVTLSSSRQYDIKTDKTYSDLGLWYLLHFNLYPHLHLIFSSSRIEGNVHLDHFCFTCSSAWLGLLQVSRMVAPLHKYLFYIIFYIL